MMAKFIEVKIIKELLNKKIGDLLKENIEFFNKGMIHQLQCNANKIDGLNNALFLINKCEKR
jgi:hypothetical protein